MTKKYRYELEKGSKKHRCPSCGKKSYVRYFDTKTSDNLPKSYGRCDRESNCGYHNKPPKPQPKKKESIIRQYKDRLIFEFEYSVELKDSVKALSNSRFNKDDKCWYIISQGVSEEVREFAKKHNFVLHESKNRYKSIKKVKPKVASKSKRVFIPSEILKATFKGYEKNVFIQNLLKHEKHPFLEKDVEQVINHYCLGTITKGPRAGAITFPFIDINDEIRTIQVKQFDQNNKTASKGTDFLHAMFKRDLNTKKKPLPQWLQEYLEMDYTMVSCLFGEHLLTKYPTNPIGLVEAPKTAIYATLYFGFPDNSKSLLWLAVYNLSSLNYEKCKELNGRQVILFPDLSKNGHAFKLWSTIARKLSQLIPAVFTISDLLERYANSIDKEKGLDLGDYLIRHDWRKFRVTNSKSTRKRLTITETSPSPEQVIIPKSDQSDQSGALKTKKITGSFSSQSQIPTFSFGAKGNNNKIDERKKIVSEGSLSSLSSPPPDWTPQIEKLEKFFSGLDLPSEPWKLNVCTTVVNTKGFVDSSLASLKANNGNPTFHPELQRLQKAKEIFTNTHKNNE